MDNLYNEVRQMFSNKILNTRKQRFAFVKWYLIGKYQEDYNVRRLKEVMYGETKPITNDEKEAVYIFELYTELLESRTIKNLAETVSSIKLTIDSENIVDTIMSLYSKIDLVYLFMIMNYMLVCNNLPIINPYKNRYDDFINVLNNQDKESFYMLLIDVLSNTEVLDLNYYEKCLETNRELIINYIKDNKNKIEENGKIEHIYLFGSYADGLTRYDSDIDLLVLTKDDLTYEEKLKGINYIRELVRRKFKRIVDIHETTNELLIREDKRLKNRILIF